MKIANLDARKDSLVRDFGFQGIVHAYYSELGGTIIG